MGQYYMAYAENEKGERKVWDVAEIASCGLKLMEHSWLRNSGVNTVMKQLLMQGPLRIIWMGDYADDDDRLEQVENGAELYKYVWNREDRNVENIPNDPVDLEKDRYYLVNNTKKTYIDLNAYEDANTDEDGWCIHPLPLLTAIGNGNGGGDYSGKNEDIVGTWAYNFLSLSETAPDGYEDVTGMVSFKEEY